MAAAEMNHHPTLNYLSPLNFDAQASASCRLLAAALKHCY
jgi:hypothetical protein